MAFLERQGERRRDALPPSEAQRLGAAPAADLDVGTALKRASEAVEKAPVSSVGTAALYSGVATLGTLVAGSVLGSVDVLPLVPEAIQLLGFAYCSVIASRFVTSKQLDLTPLSPIKTFLSLVEQPQLPALAKSLVIPESVDQDVVGVLQELAGQRDSAISQLGEMKKAVKGLTSVKAEKEALEAVALQLAQERDNAVSQVMALKGAVDAMTERMKAIEAMLEQEVKQLKQQNQALETVALQLAAERDSAIHKAKELQEQVEVGFGVLKEKKDLETFAVEMTAERDSAMAEIAELKEVVAGLSSSGSASRLTPEQEIFIKARIRSIRADYIDINKSYDEQSSAVDKLVNHLVHEYGAPSEWTKDYMVNFLESSSSSGRSLGVTGVPSLAAEKAAQTTP
eukprot:SM000007S20880  [mRNA]  locus=s7:743163:745546:+ [translate_table: standard]